MNFQQALLDNEGVFTARLPITPANQPFTIYVGDLPKNTSYIDLAQIFEKGIGPCTIQMQRYTPNSHSNSSCRQAMRFFYSALVTFQSLEHGKLSNLLLTTLSQESS